MQVQSISNPKSDINFKSASAIDKASAFVNMDESQVRLLSYVSGHDKKREQKKQNSLMKAFYAIPIVDTIASAVLVNKSNKLTDEAVAALRKTKLSTRLARAAGTAGFWAVSLSAIEIYGAIKKSIEAKSPNAKRFDRENPATSLLTDVLAILAGGALAIVGLNKLAVKSLEKHPERLDEARANFRKARRLINGSKFNQVTLPKLVERVTKLAEKRPSLVKAGRFALANSVLILFGLGFLKMVGHSRSERNRVEKNYKQIKHAQLKVAKQVINNLTEEKKALTEELKVTAQDRNQMEEEVKEVKRNCCENESCVEETVSREPETTETESVEE